MLLSFCARAPALPPQSLSKPAASLVRQLLTSDDSQRIGLDAVKKHPFFAQVDWEHLRRVEPTIKPAQRHPNDVEARWSGADLDAAGGEGDEEDDDEGWDSTFESRNIRKLALMHLDDELQDDAPEN
jgi:hypothetical protein